MDAKYYTFNVGKIECTILLDGSSQMTMKRILRAFPEATEAEYRQAYADINVPINEADISFNILLAKIGSETILVDTGEAGKPYGGWLLESMKLANIDPESITVVIITHSHGDHVFGLLSDDNQAAFPNARYVISKAEMNFWQETIENGHEDYRPLLDMIQSGNLQLIDMDEEIIEGLTAIPLAGHTPGQIGLLLESENERLLHLADLLHLPIQFAHPEWSAAFDSDTSLSVPMRRKMLKYAADENLLTLFYHLTFPSLGYIEQVDENFIWKALGN